MKIREIEQTIFIKTVLKAGKKCFIEKKRVECFKLDTVFSPATLRKLFNLKYVQNFSYERYGVQVLVMDYKCIELNKVVKDLEKIFQVEIEVGNIVQ